ncbi:MAG TPA: 3'-5' exonuclease, partial [Rhodothermia bacterium]|nr:3'-5' exonuclease [Rhodothermia bacterium]
RNILNFEKDQRNVQTVRLEQNYRSTKRILQLADSVIKHNHGQIEKTLWTDNPEGDHIVVIEALSEKDEAQKLQQTIRDLHLRSSFSYGDFAILYRTNAQSRSLEDALRRASIPYEIIGGVNFYQRREIKDALAYLRLVVNPKDNESLRRIINYPARGIGDKTLQAVTDFAAANGISLWEAVARTDEIDLPGRARSAVNAFKELIERHAENAETRAADDVARALIQETGILTNLRDENTIEGLARWENVQELISAIAEFVSNEAENPTLSGFLQEVSLITNVDTAKDSDQQVKLMTLHSSKGLEFPVVCIAGLEEGLFPLQGSAMDPADIEEERRLLYVGITRAEQYLFLSSARSRFRFGQSQSSVPSRFLEEMDSTVLHSETGRDFHEASTYDHLPHRRQFAYRESARRYRPPIDDFDNPSDQLDELDDAASDTPAELIVAGMRVKHELFGSGKVLAIEGKGDQARATVFFNRVGQKKLVLKFAKLRQIV